MPEPIITSSAFAGKRYAVLGLARSGLATVDTLLASGAEVTVWDSREEQAAPFEGRATIADPLTIDLTGFDGVVVSPGVPLNRHPIAAHARTCGVPVIGDIELFAQSRASLPPHKVVAITGTNGKSTTTALIAHVLKTVGNDVQMGGNIGAPILSLAMPSQNRVHVVECSSFQIDRAPSLNPSIGIHLTMPIVT